MAKPKGNLPEKTTGAGPAVPAAAIRDSRIGGTIALLCAAAISAQTLFGLGRVIGLSAWTAWLLPAALDVYAMTATRVAFQVPTTHRARAKALRNARLALTFTTGSNCLYHAMHLAANHAAWTATDWALIVVSALPPIIVERLLHLQSIVNSDAAPAPAPAPSSGIQAAPAPNPAPAAPAFAAAPSRPAPAPKAAPNPALNPASAPALAALTAAPAVPGTKPAAAKTGTEGGTGTGSSRRSVEEWAELAEPLWKRYVKSHNGEPPTAPVLAALLRNAHPELRTGESERWERNVCAAVKERLAKDTTAPADATPAAPAVMT